MSNDGQFHDLQAFINNIFLRNYPAVGKERQASSFFIIIINIFVSFRHIVIPKHFGFQV